MKMKLLSIVLALILVGTLLSGCGGNEDAGTSSLSDTGSEEKGESSTEKASTDSEIVITYAHFFDETEAFYAPIQHAVEAFNAANKGKAVIEQDILAHDAFALQMETRGATGDLPDITLVLGSQAKKYGVDGYLVDLQPLLKESGALDRIYPHTFTEHKLGDQIFTLPLEDANYGFILYNKEIFDEVGISEFPKTYSEFIEASKKIADAGYIPLALGDKDKWPADSLMFSAFVNPYVGNAWFEDIFNLEGNSKFTDAEFVSALTAFQGLATEGVLNKNLVSISNDDRLSLYMTKKAAMISAGNWECGVLVSSEPEIAANTYANAWPEPDTNSLAKKSIVSSSAWGVGVSSNVDDMKLEYIVDFISNYVCENEYGKILAETKSAFVPFEIEFDESKVNVVTNRMLEAVKESDACLNWDSSLPPEVRQVYQAGLQELLIETLTPEELAEQMQETYEEVLANK